MWLTGLLSTPRFRLSLRTFKHLARWYTHPFNLNLRITPWGTSWVGFIHDRMQYVVSQERYNLYGMTVTRYRRSFGRGPESQADRWPNFPHRVLIHIPYPYVFWYRIAANHPPQKRILSSGTYSNTKLSKSKLKSILKLFVFTADGGTQCLLIS